MAASKFQVVMATPELARAVARDARQADIDELWASARVTPLEAVNKGLEWSTAFVALADGEPLCAFGIVPFSALSASGAPWMVGTNKLEFHAVRFIKHCRLDLAKFFGEWSRLFNVVDARNVTAIRWLKWLGFTVSEPIPYGPFGLPFCPFFMEPNRV